MSPATAVLQQTIGPLLFNVFQILIVVAFIVVPLLLLRVFWVTWIQYVRGLFFSGQQYTLIELKIPKGIAKSPLAMELFITALYQTGGEGTFYDKYWLGKTRPWFSLEIVSIDGHVRFFIWTREAFRHLVESQLYGQFPDIEMKVVEDYTDELKFNWEEHQMWSCDFTKAAASHYPIKTYINYGLDKDPEEEVKIDPITSLIEFFGSIGRGEQLWLQIIIRAHKEEITKPGTWFEKVDWRHAAKAEVDKLMGRDKKAKDGEINFADFSLTKGQREKVDLIEKHIAKLAFDAVIRAVYVTGKDQFKGTMVPGVVGILRQYNSPDLNGFKPGNTTSYDYPWQDFTGKRTIAKKERAFFVYKNRSAFYPEFFPKYYVAKPFVMTTEELATIYHFPGDVSRTPNLGRISAKKAEPPSNLPM